jgi:hypothetical protein
MRKRAREREKEIGSRGKVRAGERERGRWREGKEG